MNNQSTFITIIKIIVGLVLASLAIKVLFALFSGLFWVAFRYGIPLLLAIGIVYLVSPKNNQRR